MSRTFGVTPSPRRSKRLVQSGYYTPNEDEDLTTSLLTFDDTESVSSNQSSFFTVNRKVVYKESPPNKRFNLYRKTTSSSKRGTKATNKQSYLVSHRQTITTHHNEDQSSKFDKGIQIVQKPTETNFPSESTLSATEVDEHHNFVQVYHAGDQLNFGNEYHHNSTTTSMVDRLFIRPNNASTDIAYNKKSPSDDASATEEQQMIISSNYQCKSTSNNMQRSNDNDMQKVNHNPDMRQPIKGNFLSTIVILLQFLYQMIYTFLSEIGKLLYHSVVLLLMSDTWIYAYSLNIFRKIKVSAKQNFKGICIMSVLLSILCGCFYLYSKPTPLTILRTATYDNINSILNQVSFAPRSSNMSEVDKVDDGQLVLALQSIDDLNKAVLKLGNSIESIEHSFENYQYQTSKKHTDLENSLGNAIARNNAELSQINMSKDDDYISDMDALKMELKHSSENMHAFINNELSKVKLNETKIRLDFEASLNSIRHHFNDKLSLHNTQELRLNQLQSEFGIQRTRIEEHASDLKDHLIRIDSQKLHLDDHSAQLAKQQDLINEQETQLISQQSLIHDQHSLQKKEIEENYSSIVQLKQMLQTSIANLDSLLFEFNGFKEKTINDLEKLSDLTTLIDKQFMDNFLKLIDSDENHELNENHARYHQLSRLFLIWLQKQGVVNSDKLNVALQNITQLSNSINLEVNHKLEKLQNDFNVESAQKEQDFTQLKSLISKTKTDHHPSHGSLSSISEDMVKAWIKDALDLYSADRVGMADYALETSGGQVVNTRCSKTFNHRTALVRILGIPLFYNINSPRSIIQANTMPGDCWAFEGQKGYAVIGLSSTVFPTSFTLEHIPKTLALFNTTSAPKDFSVYGLNSPTDYNGDLLGVYRYSINGPAIQNFVLQNDGLESPIQPYKFIELQVSSNWGHDEFTCVYRFRVHGTPYYHDMN